MAFFDWRDEELFDEALESIDPMKIAVRSEPVIVVGPIEVGHMPMRDFTQVVRQDDDRFCAIDARPDLEGKCAQIEKECGHSAGYFVLGLVRLDLADETTYRPLLTAFEDRVERFRLWSPHIEF
jgi:hypothetical protein